MFKPQPYCGSLVLRIVGPRCRVRDVRVRDIDIRCSEIIRDCEPGRCAADVLADERKIRVAGIIFVRQDVVPEVADTHLSDKLRAERDICSQCQRIVRACGHAAEARDTETGTTSGSKQTGAAQDVSEAAEAAEGMNPSG